MIGTEALGSFSFAELERITLEELEPIFGAGVCAALEGVRIHVAPEPLLSRAGEHVWGYAVPWPEDERGESQGEIFLEAPGYSFAHEAVHVLDWKLEAELLDPEHTTWRGRGISEALERIERRHFEAGGWKTAW